MAPLLSTLLGHSIRAVAIDGLGISSLELDRRSSTGNFNLRDAASTSTLGFVERDGQLDNPALISDLLKRTPTSSSPGSPNDAGIFGRSQTTTSSSGDVGINPQSINNKFLFFLFAILGASMVLASIWFFFWAKNGGFVFRKGDWDEYKSTVLRRKGPDGRTLSNATKSTKLGGGSIDGDYDDDDLVHNSMARDRDVRDYRHEKPARVGGMNRRPDGSYYTGTNTDRSDVMTEKSAPPKKSKKLDFFHRKEKKAPREKSKKSKRSSRSEASTGTSVTQEDASTITDSYASSDAHNHHRHHRSHTGSRQSSPRKHRTSRHNYPETVVSDASYLNGGYAESGDLGTRSYHHPIPELTQGARTVVSDETESKPKRGYRRGRRDSLDSN